MTHWLDGIRTKIEAAVNVYERSAPTVYDWLDALYVRINEEPATVRLPELLFVERLQEDGQWTQANHAANQLYHLETRLGRETVGQAGY